MKENVKLQLRKLKNAIGNDMYCVYIIFEKDGKANAITATPYMIESKDEAERIIETLSFNENLIEDIVDTYKYSKILQEKEICLF